MNNSTEYFDKLVSKALDSTLTNSEVNQLESMLNTSKEFQKRYCNTVLLESLFHWEDVEEASTEEKVISFPVLPAIASIAAILVCLFSAWAMHKFSFHPTDRFENLKHYADSKVSESEKNFVLKTVSQKDMLLHSPSQNSNIIEKTREILTNSSHSNEDSLGMSILIENGLTFMSFEQNLLSPTSNGVLPLRDGNMLQMREMDIDPITKKSSSVEILRIYELKNTVSSDYVDVETSIHINQSVSDTSDQTEFILSLHALGDGESQPLSEIGSTAQAIMSDNDQTTWEKIETSFSLPEGTEYLVVSLAAQKHGLSALNAHHHEFFADELDLSFAGI